MANLLPERKAELESGVAQTTNLAECLAIDQAVLIHSVLPELGLGDELAQVREAHQRVSDKGISHQISAIGVAIGEVLLRYPKTYNESTLDKLTRHPSDTVRSWAAFAATRSNPDASLFDRLNAARPFAADTHFGVREWAWLAVRPYIAQKISDAIELLVTWTDSEDPNIRRFAVESTRPRGVWCEHIMQLKTNPIIAEPLLEPLKEDVSRYVQDSVANWLNDASKTSPKWVIQLCDKWSGSGNATTERIINKAMRSIRKDSQTTQKPKKSSN